MGTWMNRPLRHQKLNDRFENSKTEDPDEAAHYEPSYLNLCCL